MSKELYSGYAIAVIHQFCSAPPHSIAEDLLALWQEFERAGTEETGEFAKVLDRFQPLVTNVLDPGGTRTENSVSFALLFSRYGPMIYRGAPLHRTVCEQWVIRYFVGCAPEMSTGASECQRQDSHEELTLLLMYLPESLNPLCVETGTTLLVGLEGNTRLKHVSNHLYCSPSNIRSRFFVNLKGCPPIDALQKTTNVILLS